MRQAVDVFVGDAARAWSGHSAVAAWWDDLYGRCSWSVPFLSRIFFDLWFAHYGADWSPVLVVGRDVDALMPLAQRDGVITGVGAHQAEYHGWLESSAATPSFFNAVLDALADRLPTATVRLRYLVPETSDAVLKVSRICSRATVHRHARPLLPLDVKELSAVLRKKGNKNKLNRLKRVGELATVRLNTQNFTQYLDEIIDLYDFRQGAINDSIPFLDDAHKRGFFESWMASAPDQLYATGMLLDGRVLAAQISLATPTSTHLLVVAHSPEYTSSSPGRLHLHQAALAMAEDGKQLLDLTPGEDPWKSAFAVTHDEVLELEVHPTKWRARRVRGRNRVVGLGASILKRIGVKPTQLRALATEFRWPTVGGVGGFAKRVLYRRDELRIYRMDLGSMCSTPLRKPSVGSLRDLKGHVWHPAHRKRQSFLSDALQRMQTGDRPYTFSSHSELLHCGWLVVSQSESLFTEVDTKFQYPEPGAVLYDFFTVPSARGRGYYQCAIQQMLLDLRNDGCVTPVYVAVLADNAASRHVIEKLGFSHFCSLYRVKFLGVQRKWNEMC